MTEREALKLALEALEKLWNIIDDIDTYGDMAKDDEKLYRTLVERRQRTRFEETGITTDGYELSGGAITAIKEVLAQPKQEFVAYIDMSEWPPVRFKEGTLRCDIAHLDGQKLYTTPPQRKPLTDKEIILIVAECAASHQHTDIHFARAIERAHGIKELV